MPQGLGVARLAAWYVVYEVRNVQCEMHVRLARRRVGYSSSELRSGGTVHDACTVIDALGTMNTCEMHAA